MKPLKRKLTLKSETMANLSNDELRLLKGGGPSDQTECGTCPSECAECQTTFQGLCEESCNTACPELSCDPVACIPTTEDGRETCPCHTGSINFCC